ncbi:DNA polymerase III subunit epsilon [Corynebacterium diphtheriae]|nr:DNA polymerase III subunit epsilon [Corynebacterium diphtheriae]
MSWLEKLRKSACKSHEDTRLLAVDMETTSLDPRRGSIVSIGWIPVENGVIMVGQAGYQLVYDAQARESVGDSATVHYITDAMRNTGVAEQEAVARLLEVLGDSPMLVHFAAIEKRFLSAAMRKYWGRSFSSRIVDTFEIERRHMERMATYPRGEDLRLARVRQRYGLPAYTSHHAASDALACAELYLAQRYRSGSHG